MLLAIDIGNTNTVFALYSDAVLSQSWRCQTIASRSADEYASFLNELFVLAGVKWGDVTGVIISSVVPDANFHVKEFCRKYLKHEAIFVDHDMAGVDIDLERPQEVGADRLVNAVAIKQHYKTPAIVIDFGTATTFDVIDEQGRYIGGVICPGINLSVSALHQAAAKLPSVSIKRPEKIIGKDTVSAIQSGIYWGYMGLIEGVVANIKKELNAQPIVIATGGLAPLFFDNTEAIHKIDDQLILKGLLAIYQNHEKNT